MVGAAPWGAVAARDLAAAGLGALHLVADDEPAAEELARTLLADAPGCALTRETLTASPGDPLAVSECRFDLVMACLPPDDLVTFGAVARLSHAARAISVSAAIDGLDAVLGPAVVPGETACWDCARRRRLAHADKPRLSHALHDALLEARPPRRQHGYLSPASAALGYELAAAAMELLVSPATSPLVGRMMVRSLVDLDASSHLVLPMPTCDVCGGAAAIRQEPGAGDLGEARDAEELRRMLEGVVDARTGIVSRLFVSSQDSPYGADKPVMAHAVLGAYSPCALHDHEQEPEDGSGKGLTIVEALIGAVGEAVERYAAGQFEGAKLVRASVSEMAGEIISPRQLGLYSDAQYAEPGFPFAPIGGDTPIEWARGVWLDTGEPVSVPALTTYYNYHARREAYFSQVTSNGLAAGRSVEDAALRAALELVERDAYTLTWLARLPAPRVRIDEGVSAGAREVARRLVGEAGEGGRLTVYSLDVGLRIPVMMCVVYGDGVRWPGASIAIASHLRPRVAIEKAILEQAQAGYYYRRLLEEGRAVPPRPEDVHTLVDHALYYFPRSRARAFGFLDHGGEIRASELPEPKHCSLGELTRRVAAAGLRIAIVDVTSSDLAPTPFRVVRAQGPGFQQIHFGHRLPRLGNPRLQALAPNGTNPDPHPLD